MRYSYALTALPFAFCAGFANAEAATDAGATELTAVLQTYLGAADGVVSVAVDGEDYAVTLDFAPLVAAMPEANAAATISPILFQLTDNGDGTWEMTQDQAFDLSVKVPGQLDMGLKIGNLTGTGTFDEALQAFTTSSTKLSDIAMKQVMTDPTLGESTVAYTVASAAYDSEATAAAIGVNSASTFVMNDLSEDFTLPGMGAEPMAIKIKAATYAANATIEGLRPDALYKLIAFFVANPNEAAVIAQQEGLKAILRDGMPFFDHMISEGSIIDIKVTTPQGEFGMDSTDITVEANGAVADGMVREAFAFSGLTMPAGLVPDWATELVPSQLSIDFKLTRFDLAAPLTLLLDTVDFATGPADPAAFEGQMMMALMPEGVVDVTIAPGGVEAPAYTLGYEGKMSAGTATMPVGAATVTLQGLAAVREILAKAPEDIAMQAGPVLTIAEGMAKPGADGGLVWQLEMTEAGGMLVNGVDMMGSGAQ